ncbi:MAG TPA: hypothetical protein VIP08_11225 [Phenylobacterium sp.]|uniref:hypothetical protein n=1 Tax=Phenylobacterium sp. TaxID=1871053 RepID=UPI002F92A7AF
MRQFLIVAALAAVLPALGACDQPAPWARAAVAPEPAKVAANLRPQVVRWSDEAGRFEINGAPLKAGRLWTFDGSTEGFMLTGGEALPAPAFGLDLRNLQADPMLRSPKGLELDGDRYSLVLVRLTRVRAGADWDGAVFYSTAAHRESGAFQAKPIAGANPAVGETVVLVYDMANLALGGEDWKSSLIDQIRLDTDDQAGGAFTIHQVAITENPGPVALAQAPAASTSLAAR